MTRKTLIASTGKLLGMFVLAANATAAPVVLEADPAASAFAETDLRARATPYFAETPLPALSVDSAAPAVAAAATPANEVGNLPLAAAAGMALLVAQLRRRKHAHAV